MRSKPRATRSVSSALTTPCSLPPPASPGDDLLLLPPLLVLAALLLVREEGAMEEREEDRLERRLDKGGEDELRPAEMPR